MREVGVHEAKTHLSKLLRDVEAGSEVVILRSGTAVARIVSVPATAARVLGSDRGVLVAPDDVDAPLPESVLGARRPSAPPRRPDRHGGPVDPCL